MFIVYSYRWLIERETLSLSIVFNLTDATQVKLLNWFNKSYPTGGVQLAEWKQVL